MANNKCSWKKTRDNSRGFVFRCGDKKELFAQKTRIGYALGVNDLEKLNMEILNKGNKPIKTKSEALRKARTYMKSHGRMN